MLTSKLKCYVYVTSFEEGRWHKVSDLSSFLCLLFILQPESILVETNLFWIFLCITYLLLQWSLRFCLMFPSDLSMWSKYVYMYLGGLLNCIFSCVVFRQTVTACCAHFFDLHNWLNAHIITSCMFLQSTGCATIDRLFYVDNIHLSGTINRLRYVSWAIDRLNFAQDIKYQYTQYSWYHLQFCSCTVN